VKDVDGLARRVLSQATERRKSDRMDKIEDDLSEMKLVVDAIWKQLEEDRYCAKCKSNTET